MYAENLSDLPIFWNILSPQMYSKRIVRWIVVICPGITYITREQDIAINLSDAHIMVYFIPIKIFLNIFIDKNNYHNILH